MTLANFSSLDFCCLSSCKEYVAIVKGFLRPCPYKQCIVYCMIKHNDTRNQMNFGFRNSHFLEILVTCRCKRLREMKKVFTQKPEKPEFSERGVREASHERSALTKHSAMNTKHSAQQNASTLDAKLSSCTGHQYEHKTAHRSMHIGLDTSLSIM